jgi:hypothetical protein
MLSSEAPKKRVISDAQRALLAEQVNADLALLQDATGFDASGWNIG